MMSCAIVSLLTNITRVPTAVCTSDGATPPAEIVTTLTAGGGAGAGGPGVGTGGGGGAGPEVGADGE